MNGMDMNNLRFRLGKLEAEYSEQATAYKCIQCMISPYVYIFFILQDHLF